MPLLAGVLSACGGAPEYEEEASTLAAAAPSSGSVYVPVMEEPEVERDPFDDDAARDRAEDEVADDSYVGIGAPYGCTEDCSGHEAGFRYRADHGYAGYNADSPSFNEGGQAFEEAVEERVQEMRDDYESGGNAPY